VDDVKSRYLPVALAAYVVLVVVIVSANGTFFLFFVEKRKIKRTKKYR
jgi:hypothetical protein